MNISEIAYRYRPVILLLAIGIMVFGFFSYFTLPAQEDPKITIRESIVRTVYPGLSAERVELLMTKPIEEALLAVKGIEEIRSTSSDGTSIVYAKAYDALNPELLAQTWDEIEEAANDAARLLPAGASKPVVNDDFGDVAVITMALTGDDYVISEIFDFAQYIRDRLISVPGTQQVDIFGNRQERIYIETPNAKLAEMGIAPDEFFRAIRAQNVITPGGVLDTGDRSFSIIPSGELQTIDDVKNILIRLPSDGSIIRLGDLLNVYKGYADPVPQSAFFNGQKALVLSVVMRPGQSVINYSKVAKEAIKNIQSELPLGLNLSVITWQADQVENAVYGVSANVLMTLAIVLGVVILFLGVRTGLIVGSIVPAVVLATLAIMSFSGMALERMSLATIIIALGLLVDNGVVIAEDFKRRLAENNDRDKALVETGRELAIPLLSSSLTTILVFMPLMLAQHSAGEYTRNISLVILITLSVSWVLAMSVTPTLCHMFLKAPDNDDIKQSKWSPGMFGKIEQAYEQLLRIILKFRRVFVPAMFLLLPLGGLLVGSTPAKFFPDSDRAQVLVYVNLPAGVTTTATEARMQEMVEIIQNKDIYPELGDMVSYVGFGGPRFVLSLAPLDPSPHVGFMVINAANQNAVRDAIPRLRRDFLEHLPDVEARVSGMFLGPSDPNVIQVQIKGPDAAYIVEESKKLEALLVSVPGTIDIWSNWYNPVTRFEVQVDQQRALKAGISSADIATTLSNYVTGRPISEFRDFDEVYPIVSRGVEQERSDVSRLLSMAVFPEGGAYSVPLGQVANIGPVVGFPHIQRENLERTITIEARNLITSPEDMAPMIQDKIDKLNAELKPGHVIEFDGIVEDSVSGKQALFASFPLCLGLVVLLLVAQFNGYRRPLIVLLTIPLVVIGVGLGLVIMQAKFGFLVILGLFALAGIIVNNAIVLIDRIDIERKTDGQSDWEAVITACTRRLRPILITTITTIVGLLPLIIGQDVLFYGMASIMAFGLAIGTLLTLGVAPALYCLFFNIKPHEEPKNINNSAKQLTALLLMVVLTGCTTVGPKYMPPKMTELGFSEITDDTSEMIAKNMEINPQWWSKFNDPQLSELINRALVHNTDIRAATARLDEIYALRQATKTGQFPTVNLTASSARINNSENLINPPGAPLEYSTHSIGFGMNWEIDFFGRIKKMIESADAQFAATYEDRRGVMLMTLGEISSNYFNFRSLQNRLEINNENEAIAEETYQLTELLVSKELGSEFDLVRARAELAEVKAQKSELMAALRISASRIAVISGQLPANLMDELLSSNSTLPKPQKIPVGLPSELVSRRPDIRSAERLYAASIADIGIETADLYPRFSLTGNRNNAALLVSDLFESASQAWSFAGMVKWPLFDGGKNRAEIEAAKARSSGSLIAYESAVLKAFDEVESAFASYVYSIKRSEDLEHAVNYRAQVMEMAKLRFDQGLDDMFLLLDAQRRWLSARNSLAISNGNSLNSQVRVYQSLGGGWEQVEPENNDVQ